MSPELFAGDPLNRTDNLFRQALDDVDDYDDAPSLPVVLLSAISGIGGGVIALYVGYGVLHLGIQLTAALATLGLLFGVGVSGAAMSAVTGTRGAATNMLFSCGVIVLVLVFLSVCMVFGAVAATLLVTW